jgi:acetyl esterase/lipase
MNTRIIFAVATAFALGCSGTAALARNWLTNQPEATAAPLSDQSTPTDITINYGARARVRLYRPDGEYEIHNGKYVRALSGSGDVDGDARTTDN